MGFLKRKEKTEPKVKHRFLRWKGLMAEYERLPRTMVLITLAVVAFTLISTNFGFAGIGLEGDYNAYAVLIMLPITCTSLLLGTREGTVMGFFGGVLLYLHAKYMPISYYELVFVTQQTSVIMLTVVGFLSGVLFAFALRNDPGIRKKIVYVSLVCIFISWLYSTAFITVIVTRVAEYVEARGITEATIDANEQNVVARVFVEINRLGDIGEQMFIDALLMALSSIVCIVVTRGGAARKGERSLHRVFNIWLILVVAIAFMINISFRFAAVTNREIGQAKRLADDESSYLCAQLDSFMDRVWAFSDILEKHGIEEQVLSEEDAGSEEDLASIMSIGSLLDGYDVEDDGTVLILYSDGISIYRSDEPAIPNNSDIYDVFDEDVADTIVASFEKEDAFSQVVYDKMKGVKINDEGKRELVNDSEAFANTEIHYVYSKQSEKNGFRVVMMVPSSKVFAERGSEMFRSLISTVVVFGAAVFLISRLLDLVVIRHIDETNSVLEKITAGDLDARVQARDTTEFASLSTGINQTVLALKNWIAEAETRMDSELSAAKSIQENALPRIFPPYPDILRFDIYATMNPAREVGGDFYDFFLIGENSDSDSGKLGFVLADVSGKGIPAALFMMKAMTLIRDYLQSGMDVGEAVENANRQLCAGNDSGMFVTAFVGILDYPANVLTICNAGHNPPLIWQRDGWKWLDERSGIPLGLFDAMTYSSYTLECSIGDELFIYTDGVTEAMDVNDKLFTEERLLDTVRDHYTEHPRQLIATVQRALDAHMEGAEQFDDITMLALEIGVPPEVTATLVVDANVEELETMNRFIHNELDRRLCPKRVQNQIDIATEELFVNVAHYAYPDAAPENPGKVMVNYTYSAEPPSIKVVIADSGVPFDPLAKPDAVTPDDPMEVPIGGLGILMAKKSVDKMTYERIDGKNIVTIEKKW